MKTQKRRRIECKTDYLKRIKLLKSKTPRVVFRKSNKYVMCQYVESKDAQDFVIFQTSSKELLKHGWPKEAEGSLKSLPASYLLGFLTGKKILKDKLQTPIIDFGMYRMLHKSRVFAFLKGLIDSGVKIKCEKEAFPEEDRIKGKHMQKDFSKIFSEVKSKVEKQ